MVRTLRNFPEAENLLTITVIHYILSFRIKVGMRHDAVPYCQCTDIYLKRNLWEGFRFNMVIYFIILWSSMLDS